jgi:hypothetical protein
MGGVGMAGAGGSGDFEGVRWLRLLRFEAAEELAGGGFARGDGGGDFKRITAGDREGNPAGGAAGGVRDGNRGPWLLRNCFWGDGL